MNKHSYRADARPTSYSHPTGEHRLVSGRPDRIAIWAVVMSCLALLIGVASAHAGSGGVASGGGSGTAGQTSAKKFSKIWSKYGTRTKRWARRTSKCESGGNPKAIGGHGKYRGAFQFMRATWKHAPRSPGGDPIRYTWRTQAVEAVRLKRRDGARHWPVCG